jgi:hypothetical protein
LPYEYLLQTDQQAALPCARRQSTTGVPLTAFSKKCPEPELNRGPSSKKPNVELSLKLQTHQMMVMESHQSQNKGMVRITNNETDPRNEKNTDNLSISRNVPAGAVSLIDKRRWKSLCQTRPRPGWSSARRVHNWQGTYGL